MVKLKSETLPEFLGRDEIKGDPAGRQPVYSVVIIGSGYGGSIAAYSIAAAFKAAAAKDPDSNKDLHVLLLERGKQFSPGDFPSSFGELPRELRLANQDAGSVSGHEGLFDVRMGSDVVAMVANGLGGGSLINAGVMLEPEPKDIECIRAGTDTAARPHRQTLVEHLRVLKEGTVFTRARRLLGGQVKREGVWVSNNSTRLTQPLRKAQALEALASARGCEMLPLEVTVNFDGQHNLAGTPLTACNQCGDCMTGCTVGAKDSLDKSLLAWAKAQLGNRLTIVTGATVGSLALDEKRTDRQRWRLRVYHTDAALQAREVGNASKAQFNGNLYLHAENVMLAAGTLGSPEILLRSRSDKLVLSAQLGESFSANGDDIAAVHRLPQAVHGSADERTPLDQRCVGPTTTARVTLQGKYRPFQVEEFAVPGPVKRLFDETVTTSWAISRLPQSDEEIHREGDADPMAVNPGAMLNTLLVGVVGHDSADGCLQLAQPLRPRDAAPQLGALRIHWPQARHGKEFDDAHETLREFAQGQTSPSLHQEPVLVANPMWRLLPAGLEELVTQPRGPVLTVHPLGGCRIGANVHEGVVDTLGRVFDARSADATQVFKTLVVLDGSIIGSSLGVNPALTISALALHAMDRHVSTWEIGAYNDDADTEPMEPALEGSARKAPPSPCQTAPDPANPAPAPLPSRTSVSITERLWGPVSLRGTTSRHVLELTLAFAAQPVSTLISPDRQPMLALPQASRLRLYAAEDWQQHHLKAASDGERQRHVLYEAAVGGSLRFLHREPSTPCERKRRGLWAWLRNRGWRDLWQRLREPRVHGEAKPKWNWAKAREFINLASHNGQRRGFDYQLQIGELLRSEGELNLLLRPGAKIEGSKQLGYARRASPWTQLTEMQLTRLPGLARAATLKLDARFLAQQGKPLLHIEQQHDHAEALAELMSFGLYLFRVLLATHLWSFRRPDHSPYREAHRLPGDIPGLPSPQVTTLVVDRWRADDDAPYEPVTIRLTRYARPGQEGQPAGKPLVMLHGYSASGTTFTHPTLKGHGAAAFFCHQGRDVWVVDLRTSCGLPTAVLPWAMEQPALVDIPAALLHIKNVTGQKVDVLAHCIGGAMLGMAVLSDATSVGTGQQQLGVDSWLTSEHFGTLTAFNGPAFNDPIANGPAHSGAESTLHKHPTIDRIVLSQKGPVLRYTDANLLRAYVLQFVRRWLLPPNFSFQPSRDPGVAEQLLDRFLSSLPYPAMDFDTENPLRPCARTEWVAARHRLDALFGRVFSANNLRPETLAAINDLFGPINLDTVAQTIHFARFDAITNQRGRGEFVTRQRLRLHWGDMPTLLLHGEDNGLVDPHTQVLLHQQLAAAGVPVVSLPLLQHVGHQDSLIGTSSHRVFKEVEAFLSDPVVPPLPNTPGEPSLVCGAPWLGPRLAPPLAGDKPLRVAAMSRPDQGEARLWLFAARRQALPDGTWVYALSDAEHASVKGDMRSSLDWCFATLNEPLADATGDPTQVQPGWLAVFVYALEQTTARPSFPAKLRGGQAEQPQQAKQGPPAQGPAKKGQPTQPSQQTAQPGLPPRSPVTLPDDQFPLRHTIKLQTNSELQRLAMVQWSAPPLQRMASLAGADTRAAKSAPPEVLEAVQSWVDLTHPDALDLCFMASSDLVRAAALHAPAAAPSALRFALASCQYPAGLFDRQPAQASLLALAEQPLAMALLVGDQVYADATAGLVDPTREDELFELPHQRALRQVGLRAVMRRMPVHMLLDDHELFDNWQPLPAALPDQLRRVHQERLRIQKARSNGVRAYLHYQRMLRPGKKGQRTAVDFEFMAGGHPFLMLDTRTGRQRGAPSASSEGAWIISPRRMQRLQAWLLTHHDKVKFIASPSMLLPRHQEVVGKPRNACRADAWDGFPESLAELLRFIDEKKIHHTVFLSGDAHHSLHVQARVGANRVKVVSVHSSALYAPYPFANGRPRDLAVGDLGQTLGVELETTTTPADAGDGFAVLEVAGTTQAPQLHIQYFKADGRVGVIHKVALS